MELQAECVHTSMARDGDRVKGKGETASGQISSTTYLDAQLQVSRSPLGVTLNYSEDTVSMAGG